MKTLDALTYAGGNTRLSELLGLSSGAISQWGEYPPSLRQLQIEAATGGALKAEAGLLPKKVKRTKRKNKTAI